MIIIHKWIGGEPSDENLIHWTSAVFSQIAQILSEQILYFLTRSGYTWHNCHTFHLKLQLSGLSRYTSHGENHSTECENSVLSSLYSVTALCLCTLSILFSSNSIMRIQRHNRLKTLSYCPPAPSLKQLCVRDHRHHWLKLTLIRFSVPLSSRHRTRRGYRRAGSSFQRCPVSIRLWINVGLMLAHRLRRRPNITLTLTLVSCLLVSGH